MRASGGLTFFPNSHIIMVSDRNVPVMKILFAHRKRLINVRLENIARSPEASNKCPARKLCSPVRLDGAIFKRRYKVIIKEGYVYHINDSYFKKVRDDRLMQNKERGTYRPTFFCMRDEKTSLLWMIPMSTRVEKFRAIHDRQTARYGKCLTIVLGEYDNREAAFLLQNMFPILPHYLDHIHTRNGNPVPVKYSVQQEVKSRVKQIRKLTERGIQVVFPDIVRLEKLMLEELASQQNSMQKG